jgi:carboxymethylenebutenolidase
MTHTRPIVAAAVLSLLFTSLTACAQNHATDAKPAAQKTPPGAEGAKQALDSSPRHGEWVDIAVGDAKVHTWVVYPERKDKAPVVIVIHEIFGMTDWVRAVADQLAADGFIAVAPDLLSGKGPNGGGTESLGEGARAAIGKLDANEVAQRLDAVREHALAFPSVSGKSATIGFCWGGAKSFDYATRQPKLNAAVVYYGSPPKDDAMAKTACPVLGLYGQDDNRITSTIDATKKSMADAGKSYTPHIFEGAGHGFLRQQSQREANAKAAQQAWPETIAFLKKNLE